MKKLLSCFLAATLGAAALAAQTPQTRRPAIDLPNDSTVIAQMADGGLNRSVVLVTNSSASVAQAFKINFYGDNGQPVSFEIAGTGVVTSLSGNLAPGASAFYATAGTSATTVQGWAQSDPIGTGPSIAIAEIQQYKDNSGEFGPQTTIPGTTSSFVNGLVMPFDNTFGGTSSVAFANTTGAAAQSAKVTMMDSTGKVLASDTIALEPLNHLAFEVPTRFPATANKQGTIMVTPITSGAQTFISVTGLRFVKTPVGINAAALPIYLQY